MHICENCGKGSIIGIDSTHRYGGGWSMRGQRSRKVWKPNLHSLRVKKNGHFVTMTLCAKCTRKLKAAAKPAAKPATPAPTATA